jgi:3-oxoacyl-[acyl-carrier-protein] synthase II
MNDPLVITGAGLVTPLGTGADAVWDALERGESGIRHLPEDDPRFARGVDPDKAPICRFGGFVKGFVPRELIQSAQLRRMDWLSRLMLGSARLAIQHANVEAQIAAAPERTAIVAGSAFGAQRETQEYIDRLLSRGLGAGQPFLFPNLVLNAAAGWAAIELNIQGPNITISEHEASGETALVTAFDLLASGSVDRVVVSGMDEFSQVLLHAFEDRHLLDPRCMGKPENRSSNKRTLIPGEGGSTLVLERLSSARDRGHQPLAVLVDAATMGTGCRAHQFTAPSDAANAVHEWLRERAVDLLISSGACSPARQAVDRAIGAAIGRPAQIDLGSAVGESPSGGILAAAIGALACAAGRRPGDPGTTGKAPLSAVLISGVARGGLVAPLLLQSLDAALTGDQD